MAKASSLDSDKALIKEYIETCAESVQFFAEEFLPHLLTAEIPPFHSEIYQLLPESKRLVVAAPRGFAKSYVCSIIYPIWMGVFALHKDVVIISASETLAKEMLRKIKREFENNQKLKKYFGDMVTDKWSETHATLESGVTYRARGAEGQIRGFRPECIVIDDIETDDSAKSEEQRRKIMDWIFKACLPALTPEGQLIMVGSIISQVSVLKQVLEANNGWPRRVYRAYKDRIQEPGHELWPTLWPHEKLQQRKAEIGSWAFSSEYMNDPISNEFSPIKKEQIRYWKELPQQLSLVLVIDPAYKDDEKADYKVATLVGIDQNMNRYLVHYLRTHIPQGEFIDAVLTMWQSNKSQITALGIPSGGTEAELFRSFVNKANERKLYPPFAELKNTFITSTGQTKRGKLARITAALQPLFEQGKYYINESHREAEQEILEMSDEMRWDDLIDTMCYAEQLIQPVFMEEKKTTSEFEVPKRSHNYGYE